MDDIIKHTAGTAASGVGFLGSVTLHSSNEWISFGCGIAGFCAACMTVASIIKKWNK